MQDIINDLLKLTPRCSGASAPITTVTTALTSE